MLYTQEERKVFCPICSKEVKSGSCFDSTSNSDLFYSECSGCGFELEIEHGDYWHKVKPSVNLLDLVVIPQSSQKALKSIIVNEDNKVFESENKTYYKALNTFTNAYDLFILDKLNNQLSSL
jgi:transcription elongation factor Elf1